MGWKNGNRKLNGCSGGCFCGCWQGMGRSVMVKDAGFTVNKAQRIHNKHPRGLIAVSDCVAGHKCNIVMSWQEAEMGVRFIGAGDFRFHAIMGFIKLI